MYGSRRTGTRLTKAGLITGFLALTAGCVAAITNPATGFELSIYTATPVAFWAGVGVALLIALVVAWFETARPLRTVACVLGGGAVSAVLALPILRGYYFFGHADAMTHLGWTKDLASGRMATTELIYPGIHTFAVFLGGITGRSLQWSLMFVVFLLGVLFLVLFPVGVRRLTDRDRTTELAAFSAFMLLPINLLSTHQQAHAFTQALFFSTLVLFVLFVYLQLDPRSSSPRDLGTGALLALSTAAVVLYHPQQAANLLLVFGAIAGYQLVGTWRGWTRPFRNVYGQTIWFGTVFAAWTFAHTSFVRRPIANLVGGVVGYLTGNPPTAGGAVVSQTQSLTAIGSGIVEIYLKLFLVSTVYLVLAGVLAVAVLRHRTPDDFPDRITAFLVLGLVAVTPLPVLYFLGNVAEHYFRHFGFIMLVVSILGALALSAGRRWASRADDRDAASIYKVAVPVALAVMLVLSLVTVFPSPYIHKSNRHVTQSEMTGYELALDNVDNDDVVSIRGQIHRYSDGIYGTRARAENRQRVDAANLTSLPSFFDGEGYVVISEYERRREVGAYEGLRFTEEDFEALSTRRGVDRVLANREVTLYHVG